MTVEGRMHTRQWLTIGAEGYMRNCELARMLHHGYT